MKEWKLCAAVTVSAYTVVEAETLEEAKKLAADLPVKVDPFGYKSEALDVWLIDSGDGEPFDIHEA